MERDPQRLDPPGGDDERSYWGQPTYYAAPIDSSRRHYDSDPRVRPPQPLSPQRPGSSSAHWASGSGRYQPPPSTSPTYPAYTQTPYAYPPPPHHEGPPPPVAPGGWPQWDPAYGAGAFVYPSSAAAQATSAGPARHVHHPGPAISSSTPPRSPSQVPNMPPPPPPASAPSPARSRSGSPSSNYRPGFRPDYERPRPDDARRPSTAAVDGSDTRFPYGADIRPPPPEAYLVLRPHRLPRSGWSATPDLQHDSDTSGWSYELVVLQHPERGKALGVEQLRRGWPPLTPPLIVQLIVKDQNGETVPTDNAALARRLVHLTMNVDLVSPDGTESRSLIRVRPPSRAWHTRGNVQPYYPASAPPPNSVQRTLLGSLVRTAQILTRDGRKGLYFIFQDMIVRPEGQYALKGKVLDLAGPPHIGTSIGVTYPLAHCLTDPFDVIVPQDYPGPVSITPLSSEFLRQGERHLGRRPRNEEGDSDNEDASNNV